MNRRNGLLYSGTFMGEGVRDEGFGYEVISTYQSVIK